MLRANTTFCTYIASSVRGMQSDISDNGKATEGNHLDDSHTRPVHRVASDQAATLDVPAG